MKNMKKWYPVRVYFPATYPGTWMELPAHIHEDEIKGTTPLDALKNAIRLWRLIPGK